MTEPQGTINIPGPLQDNFNVNCLWTIRAPPFHAVQLNWIVVPSRQIFNPDNVCKSDFIEVVENYGTDRALSLGKLVIESKKIQIKFVTNSFRYCSGKKPHQIMTSQGRDLSIHFRYPRRVVDVNYQVVYAFVNSSHSCGGHFFSETGTVTSPNFPNYYPKDKECVWVIEAADRHIIELNFLNFTLESSVDCLYDYLEIR